LNFKKIQKKGTIEIDKEKKCLIANGNVIQFIYSNDPTKVEYEKYDINNAIVFYNLTLVNR
jgi:glyceraldehyde 3-phosphate dehydrogenase